MTFSEVDRPPMNRRRSPDGMTWDNDLQVALMRTLMTQRAALIPLAKFHKSPVKGRLWRMGFRVRHRVVGDAAAAWLEKVDEATE